MLPLPSKIFRLITRDILNNQDEVLQMMRWRIANQKSYASRPEITEKSFRNWLSRRVLGNSPKLFFWVLGDEGKPIGHMGLRFDKNLCEIYNVARGEPQCAGRIGEALDILIRWTFDNTPSKKLYLRVLLNNNKAIEFYKKHGFVPKRKLIIRHKSSLRYLKMEYEG